PRPSGSSRWLARTCSGFATGGRPGARRRWRAPDVVTEPSPEDLPEPGGPPRPRRRAGRLWWLAGLAIAALVVVILAPLASSDPDGLERVAQDHGFLASA